MNETMKLWSKYQDLNSRIQPGSVILPPETETALMSKLAKKIRERSGAEKEAVAKAIREAEAGE